MIYIYIYTLYILSTAGPKLGDHCESLSLRGKWCLSLRPFIKRNWGGDHAGVIASSKKITSWDSKKSPSRHSSQLLHKIQQHPVTQSFKASWESINNLMHERQHHIIQLHCSIWAATVAAAVSIAAGATVGKAAEEACVLANIPPKKMLSLRHVVHIVGYIPSHPKDMT